MLLVLMVLLMLAAVGGEIVMIDTAGMADGDLLLAGGFDIFVADVVQTKEVFDERRRWGRSRRVGGRRAVEQRQTLDRRQHINQHETNQQTPSRDSLHWTNKRFHFLKGPLLIALVNRSNCK